MVNGRVKISQTMTNHSEMKMSFQIDRFIDEHKVPQQERGNFEREYQLRYRI